MEIMKILLSALGVFAVIMAMVLDVSIAEKSVARACEENKLKSWGKNSKRSFSEKAMTVFSMFVFVVGLMLILAS